MERRPLHMQKANHIAIWERPRRSVLSHLASAFDFIMHQISGPGTMSPRFVTMMNLLAALVRGRSLASSRSIFSLECQVARDVSMMTYGDCLAALRGIRWSARTPDVSGASIPQAAPAVTGRRPLPAPTPRTACARS